MNAGIDMNVMKLLIGVATLTTALTLSPPAWADPDPHIPDGNAGWCPGGDYREKLSGGGRYCLGEPFSNGAFYAQRWGHSPSPFGPGYWMDGKSCSVMVEGTVQGGIPYGGVPDCNGGPRVLH
ncbi:hypothetical protein GCM10009632_35050 [Mycolicibacterium alvei]